MALEHFGGGSRSPTYALYHNNGSGPLHRCDKGRGPGCQHARHGSRGGRLRWRRLPGHIRHRDWGKPPLPQQRQRHLHRRDRRSGSQGRRPRIWSSGAVWIDIFGHGRLDLVVCNYARWARETDLQGAFAAEIAGPSYMAPAGFVSVFPTVYRNLGNGKFVEVSSKTGLNPYRPPDGLPARESPGGRSGGCVMATGASTCCLPTSPAVTSTFPEPGRRHVPAVDPALGGKARGIVRRPCGGRRPVVLKAGPGARAASGS